MLRNFFSSVIFIQLLSISAVAGVVELSLSGNYRSNAIDSDNQSKTQSVAGSISYYFWEMSALEASYTRGKTDNTTIAFDLTADFIQYGLDFVFSFAGRESPVKPYIKVGGIYQINQVVTYYKNNPTPTVTESAGLSPSAGLGLSMRLTETFSLKFGGEAWLTPLSDKSNTQIVNIAARAGISWMF
ncbi:MAG: outer membrane beta-barrel protein [Bdellovibrionales bacterium]|nr:outer membrane beta-barrel protein [Bdellovibrionales bacterium]